MVYLLKSEQILLKRLCGVSEMTVRDSGAFPSVVKAISVLASHHTLVIVTASHGAAVKRRLVELGIYEYVSAIYGAEHGGPKHERIVKAMSEFGYDESDTWMIGDAASDVRAGRTANVKCRIVRIPVPRTARSRATRRSG